MTDLTCWGDLLAAGHGMPQSALVAVFIGPDQVVATIRPMIGGFCIDTGAVIPLPVVEPEPVIEPPAPQVEAAPAELVPLAPETVL